jgi:hypothetical protein
MEWPEEDQPDEDIWGHPELLEQHWEMVNLRRKNPGSEPVQDEADDPGSKYVKNELYERYVKEARR